MPEFFCPPSAICRPTFWNISEAFQIILYASAALATGVFALGFLQHILVWRKGKGQFTFDHFWKRALNFLTFGAATKKVVLDKQPAGIMHLNIMWGIIVLFIGTALATIDWDITRLVFNFRVLQDNFYFAYKFVLDIFGALAFIGLSIAILTRYVRRPPRLNGYSGSRFFDDDLWTVGVFYLLVITGFLLESLRIAGMSLEWARDGRGTLWFAQYSIIGSALAQIWYPLGEQTIRGLHVGVWSFHAGVTLVWLAAIPFTKNFHIFSSSINTFFKRLEPRGAIPPIRNIEEQETFGVGKFEDFTWKQVLDFDACTRCGRCQDVCPAAITGKALSPKNVIVKLYEVAFDQPMGKPRALHGEVIDAQELWDCTTCMACVEACPVAIDQLGTIIDLRRYLTLSEGAVQPSGANAMNAMERQGNPYGLPKADRLKWAEGLDVPRAQAGEEYEVLYWVGCAGSYDQRAQKISRAIVKILQAANVKFAVMSQERCNCESARRLGNEYLYQTATTENIENLGQFEFKRILTTCPHCFNTIKNEYPQFDGNFTVIHHSQFIAELIGHGRIKPAKSSQQKITYHDSCYLGRYSGIYEPQREILKSISGVKLVEMPRSRANGLCCGGGGGRMWLEERTGTRINQRRVQDVLEVKAQTVASACPFCMTMLDDGAKTLQVDEKLERKDIAELVAESL